MRRDFKGIRVAPVCRSLAGVFESMTTSQVAHPRNLRFPSVSQKAPLPSSLCDDTVSLAGSVGAERCPLGTCAPIGGGRPPYRGGCRRTATGGVRAKFRPIRLTSPNPLPTPPAPAFAQRKRLPASGGEAAPASRGAGRAKKKFFVHLFSKRWRGVERSSTAFSIPYDRKEVAPCALGTWKYRAGRPWPPWPG